MPEVSKNRNFDGQTERKWVINEIFADNTSFFMALLHFLLSKVKKWQEILRIVEL